MSDSYILKGKGIVFGGRDVVGDYFTADTDFGPLENKINMPVFYDHSLNGIKSSIGTLKAWIPTDDGIEVEIELDKRHKYIDKIMQLVKKGALGLSTGALSHLVIRDNGELKRWIVGEISLTATPAEPRTFIEAKSIKAAMCYAVVKQIDSEILTQSNTMENVMSNELTALTRDEVKSIMKEVLEASQQVGTVAQGGGIVAAPATKSVTTRGFSNEPIEAFWHFIKTGDHVAAKATLVEGTNNYGGYLVPKDFYDRIIARRNELSIIGQVPVMKITTSKRQIDIPAVSAQSSSAVVAEAGSANFSEPDFANTKVVTVYKNNISMKMSNELLNDQAANLDQFISEHIAARFALAINDQVLTGSGSSEAYGVLARATQFETAASATTLDASDIMNLQHAIPAQYAIPSTETAFAMKNSTLGYIRGLTGNWFSFQATPQGNGMDISNHPVVISDSMAAIGTGNKSVIYGNFMYYCFVENGSIEISRNPYLYQENGITAIFADYRFGGDVIQPEAFAYLVHP